MAEGGRGKATRTERNGERISETRRKNIQR